MVFALSWSRPVISKPDYSERKVTIVYDYDYTSSKVNMSVSLSLTYKFRIEYSSEIRVGEQASFTLQASDADTYITAQIELGKYNISNASFVSSLSSSKKFYMKLGYNVSNTYCMIGETIATVYENNESRETVVGFTIYGTVNSSVNVIMAYVNLYGDAIAEEESGLYNYIWTSENLTLNVKRTPSKQGNITVNVMPSVLTSIPVVIIQKLCLSIEKYGIIEIPLSEYSKNLTTTMSMRTCQAEYTEYSLGEILMVTKVISQSDYILEHYLSIILVGIIAIIYIVALLLVKIKK